MPERVETAGQVEGRTEALSLEPKTWLGGFIYGFAGNVSHDAADDAAEEIIDEFARVGWRPPLPKMDVDSLRSQVGSLIDELAFQDDDRDAAHEVAQALIDGGWLDRSGAFGSPEPVAHTLRRVIQDLENEAMFRDPVRMIGAYSERSADDVIGARVLSEYAERLRKHPSLTGEPSPPTAEDDLHWQISTRVPMSVSADERADLFHRVVNAVHAWETTERQAEVSGHRADHLWWTNQRLREQIGELDRKIAASSPLLADEVEWGYRNGPHEDDHWSVDTEASARRWVERAIPGLRVLGQRRPAGPWVAVPVEPKETNHG
jgi:hypothetical protein